MLRDVETRLEKSLKSEYVILNPLMVVSLIGGNILYYI
jgi:hypothetical protein